MSSLGGSNIGDSVRRMLRRIANNDVLGLYCLKGRKNKKNFGELMICNVVISKQYKYVIHYIGYNTAFIFIYKLLIIK